MAAHVHLGTYGRVKALALPTPHASTSSLHAGGGPKSSLSRAERQQQNNPAAQKRKARKGDFKDLANAACMGRLDDVSRILAECRQQGTALEAALNNKELSGMTPLMYASAFGHVEVVRLLCREGSDVDARDTKYGMTALHQAAANDYAEVVAELLDRGADPSIKER